MESLYLTNHYSLFLFIEKLYEQFGNENYMIDENITQTNHSLQAAYIAFCVGAPEKFIIGMLLHDIGQIVDSSAIGNTEFLHEMHAQIGSSWLNDNNFPEYICDLVKYHTVAKIILCDQDTNYYNTLSDASKESYIIQKKKMDEDEYINFINHPYKKDFLAARICDDLAKISGFNNNFLPVFGYYKDMFIRVMDETGREETGNWLNEMIKFREMMIGLQ